MNHERLDNPVEYVAVEITVLGMHAEVLHRPGALLAEERDVDVPVGCVDDGIAVDALRGRLLRGSNDVLLGRLFIEHVSLTLHRL